MAERKLRLGEVSHLVMTFLHDEQETFPATRAAFEHEARDALKAIKPGRRGVKTLYEILDEYLELKQEQKEREDRKACFKEDPVAAQQVELMMTDMRALLDDYKLLRSAQRERPVVASHVALRSTSTQSHSSSIPPAVPSHGATPETCRRSFSHSSVTCRNPSTTAPGMQVEESGDKVALESEAGYDSRSSKTASLAATSSTSGACVAEGRDAKRRKRCPARHNPHSHTRVSATADFILECGRGGNDRQLVSDSERQGGKDRMCDPEVCHSTPTYLHVGVGQLRRAGTSELNCEHSQDVSCAVAVSSPQALEGGVASGNDAPCGNLFSDISESVLSDPQIQQLLEDPSGLEDLFNDTELSWLIDPLTHHINARLAEGRGDGLPASPTKPTVAQNRVDVAADPVANAVGKECVTEGGGGDVSGRQGSADARGAGPGFGSKSCHELDSHKKDMLASRQHAPRDREIDQQTNDQGDGLSAVSGCGASSGVGDNSDAQEAAVALKRPRPALPANLDLDVFLRNLHASEQAACSLSTK